MTAPAKPLPDLGWPGAAIALALHDMFGWPVPEAYATGRFADGVHALWARWRRMAGGKK